MRKLEIVTRREKVLSGSVEDKCWPGNSSPEDGRCNGKKGITSLVSVGGALKGREVKGGTIQLVFIY